MELQTYFRDVIATEEELRQMLPPPSKLAANKVISHLDDHCRDFIARSPFLTMATADGSGHCDVSPRGDAPGFVLVLDDKHLVIPERIGNKLMDSIRNILSNPQIGLLFLIPGLGETLRINGRACVVRDPDLLARMAAQGKSPHLAIGVEVEECFIHCAKAFKRSQLWQPDSWADPAHLPNVSQILVDHIKLPNLTAADVSASLQESYSKRLY